MAQGKDRLCHQDPLSYFTAVWFLLSLPSNPKAGAHEGSNLFSEYHISHKGADILMCRPSATLHTAHFLKLEAKRRGRPRSRHQHPLLL